MNRPPQYEEAIRYYTAALVLRPDFAITHNALAGALEEDGRGNEAIAEFQEALRLKPDYVTAYTNLGSAYFRLGRPDEAIAAAQPARRIRPGDSWALWVLGAALLDKGRFDDTITVAQEAIRFHPDAVVGYLFLSKAFLGKGQLDEAVAAAQKAVNVEPDNVDGHLDLGAALQTKGLIREAIDEYRLSIRLQLDIPKDASLYDRMARALMTASDRRFCATKEALEFAKKAVALEPRRPDFLNTLGVAYYRNGEWTAAVKMLNRSIKYRPSGAESQTHFFLAMAHWQLGAKDEARAAFRMGVERMEKLKRGEAALLSLRAEAAALLGVSANDPKQPTK
jgi:tetratricopeptide (TPR) repeat protein